tara:strand:+ start:1966 stop:2217 length:252 start_codon:yes stop_codon:yes gene_type:complete
MLVALLSKPWTKVICIGFGGLLAHVYFIIRKYREAEPGPERAQRFHIIHHLMTSKKLGKMLYMVGSISIVLNLTGLYNYFEDP